MSTVNELTDDYFTTATSSDVAAYLALFASDATVGDEGTSYRGIDPIRAWRHSVPPVTYTPLDCRSAGDEHVTVARIAGEFPGSPVELTFRFTFTDDGRIQTLAIRVCHRHRQPLDSSETRCRTG